MWCSVTKTKETKFHYSKGIPVSDPSFYCDKLCLPIPRPSTHLYERFCGNESNAKPIAYFSSCLTSNASVVIGTTVEDV